MSQQLFMMHGLGLMMKVCVEIENLNNNRYDVSPSLKASNLRNVVCKFSNIISWRIVVAHDENLSFAVLAHADAERFTVFPNHLRKMSRSRCLRLDAERVLLYLVVPRINGIFSVHFVFRVGAVGGVIENA